MILYNVKSIDCQVYIACVYYERIVLLIKNNNIVRNCVDVTRLALREAFASHPVGSGGLAPTGREMVPIEGAALGIRLFMGTASCCERPHCSKEGQINARPEGSAGESRFR